LWGGSNHYTDGGIKLAYSNTTGYPSVTQILSPWIDTEWFTEESRERGTAVHEHCAAFLTGKYMIPIKREWSGYVNSFKLWADINLKSLILSEERLIDKSFGYCGQLDIACTLKTKKGIGVIDLKTGAKADWHCLQVAAYRKLFDIANPQVITQWGLGIRLKKDGSIPIVDKFSNDILMDFNLFLSALNCWKFFNKGA
jgi:hypothetical protein